jgi:hypothetical protein
MFVDLIGGFQVLDDNMVWHSMNFYDIRPKKLQDNRKLDHT